MRFRKAVKRIFALIAVAALLPVYSLTADDKKPGDGIPAPAEPMNRQAIEADTNRQIHPFTEEKTASGFDTAGFVRICGSDALELWLNKDYNTIRILNRTTGYVWGALPLENAEGLNATLNSYGNSIAAIECYDSSGIEKRYGLSSASVRYEMSGTGFSLNADFSELGISFRTDVRLAGNRLTFIVSKDSVSEKGDFRLKSVAFIPYLGAGYSDGINGYMLIPDGPGALIRFQKPKKYASTYDKKIYGKDLAIDILAVPQDLKAHRPNDYIVEEPQVLMPIYGVVHGAYQNGFLAVVDNGAEFASIVANPAAPNNPYNWVAARFDFRQKYNKNINRKEGAGAIVPQEHMNDVSPALSLYFLENRQANYDGMAVFYRDLLSEKGALPVNTKDGMKEDAVPLKLEVLASSVRDEFIGKSLSIFTRANEAEGISEKLKLDGITDLSLVYRSFTRNNEAGAPMVSRLGGMDDFTRLRDDLAAGGGRLYFYLNPVSANIDQINRRTEAANNLSNMLIKLIREDNYIMYDETYFYRADEVAGRIDKALSSDYAKISGFALDQITNRLYGDFTSGRETQRNENLNAFESGVRRFAASGNIPMYQPNQYMWRYAKEFYDAPLVSGQFLYETDTVPFLQIVLSGSVPLFSANINNGSYTIERMLRMIEYGVFPSFAVTDCGSTELYRTAEADNFSVNFDDWRSNIDEAYFMISGALGKVSGQRIVGHEAIDAGVIRIRYSGGATVYVNYTDSAAVVDNITVEPKWFAVTENNPENGGDRK